MVQNAALGKGDVNAEQGCLFNSMNDFGFEIFNN